MLKFKDEPNWANDILGLRRTCNLPLNDDNIRKMSAKDWKSFVKNAVLGEAFLQLHAVCAPNRKTYHITYHTFKIINYLLEFPPDLVTSC